MKVLNSENLRVVTEGEEARPEFLERHYTLAELSTYWHSSVRTLRAWFENEPGVVRYGVGKLSRGRARTYVSIRVPESVAARVYRKMTRKAGVIKPSRAAAEIDQ